MRKAIHSAIWLAAAALSVLPVAGGEPLADKPVVEIAFNFKEQKVMASNQFAIWVEDSRGELVRTIAATAFTGKLGGWDFREKSLPLWVEKAKVPEMPNTEFDAFSRATPPSGQLSYDWDLRDAAGREVPPGAYAVILEGTLRNENQVLYKAVIRVGGEAVVVRPEPEYQGKNLAVRSMIGNVRVSYIKP
ncbi:MAG: DUF2271 domain-containing protein [Planctomycetota bacterium]|jgi:hypothetical protein|nr:DUF2271 domain-containing protein [Planctomycetota bacterium]